MMKITGTTQVINVYKSIAQPARVSAKSVPQQKDMIEVSTSGQSFSEVMRAAKKELTRPTPKERLRTIETQVNGGTYGVDATELAGRMIVNMEM